MRVAFSRSWTLCTLTLALFMAAPSQAQDEQARLQPTREEASDSTQAPSLTVFPSQHKPSTAERERLERVHREAMEEDIREFGPKADEYIAYLSLAYARQHIWAPDKYITGLGRSGRIDGLPILEKIVRHNPRPGYRARAVGAIGILEAYTSDRTAVPTLIQALSDSVTLVQWESAKVLCALGDTISALPVLTRMARGTDRETWTADWDYHMALEAMSPELIGALQEKAKEAWQCGALRLLGAWGRDDARAIIREVAENTLDRRVRSCAGRALTLHGQAVTIVPKAGKQPTPGSTAVASGDNPVKSPPDDSGRLESIPATVADSTTGCLETGAQRVTFIGIREAFELDRFCPEAIRHDPEHGSYLRTDRFAITPDEKRAAFSLGNTLIVVERGRGVIASKPLSAVGLEGAHVWNWDRAGSKLPFACKVTSQAIPEHEAGAYYIYEVDSDRFVLVKRFDQGYSGGFPVISPDGTAIAYHRLTSAQPPNPSGLPTLWALDLRTGEERHITPGYGASPDWSPDGNMLSYVVYGDGRTEPWLYDFRTNAHSRLHHCGIGSPRFSPTGGLLCFTVAGKGDTLVIVRTATPTIEAKAIPVEPEEALPAGADGALFDPAWSPDGRRIVLRYGAGMMVDGADLSLRDDLVIVDVEGGHAEWLTTTPRTLRAHPAWLDSHTVVFVEK